MCKSVSGTCLRADLKGKKKSDDEARIGKVGASQEENLK